MGSLGSAGWFRSFPDWANEAEIKFNYVLCPFPKKDGPVCLRTGTQQHIAHPAVLLIGGLFVGCVFSILSVNALSL